MEDDLVALLELEEGERGVTLASEKHYRLVSPEEVTEDDLRRYRDHPRTHSEDDMAVRRRNPRRKAHAPADRL